MPLLKSETYTTDYIYSLPEGQRAELIDGIVYDMATPDLIHQELSWRLHQKIGNYIDSKQENCKVYAAPFAVFINEDDRNYVEPDISVICDKNKLDKRGCIGAPDWIIEITSPTTQTRDYGLKLFKYRTAGVREYWIINPLRNTVNVFDFEHDKGTGQYGFDDEISVCIYDGLTIRISDFLQQ